MLFDQYDLEQAEAIKHIHKSLQEIQFRLEHEIAFKQTTIERQEREMAGLRADLDRKVTMIAELNTKLADCQRHTEGNRQLVNKLLNDLERAQQDIEWYKRTYEKRSLLGTIKEKLRRKLI
jgi:chromosome segregation ATPase